MTYTAVKKDDLETESYVDVSLDTPVSNAMPGLCKFKLTGKVEPTQYNPCHGDVKNRYVPLQHTIGTLSVKSPDGTVEDIIPVELYGRSANSTYGFAEAKDELTECYFKKVWSNDFFLSYTMQYETNEDAGITLGNTNNRLHIFTVPASSSFFGNELPEKSDKIQAICPMAYPRTKDWLISYTSAVTTQPFTAMEYVKGTDGAEYYKIYFLTAKLTRAQLLNSKLYIKYVLQTPVYDRYTSKIYAKNGTVISFSQASVKYEKTTPRIPNISSVPLTAEIKAPANPCGVLRGFAQLSNISGAEREALSLSADGITDDSNALQNLIDNAIDTDGHTAAITIPDGIYSLGKPLELTRSNLRLSGSGNVILKPTGNFPAIKIYRPTASQAVNDVSVENLTIYLPNTAYLDGDFEGSHSGIYVDGTNGLYRTKIENITVNGIYRNAVEETDRSYGIYFKDNVDADNNSTGYVYFPTIKNINAFSVYCGLYLGLLVDTAKVTDFHWDRGADIYGYGGLLFTTFGCAYGIKCKSNFSIIDFRGQSIGDDTSSWCYKDIDNNITPLEDVIGSENVVTDSVGNEYFAPGYAVQYHITLNGKDLFLRRRNLTKANVWCHGIQNYFIGHAYDAQRADVFFHFTARSKQNRYYYPTADVQCGLKDMHTTAYTDLYGNGSQTIVTYNYNFLEDYGYENMCINPTLSQIESFASDNYINSGDGSQTSIGHSRHFGMQDNALAYIDKRSTVSVYQLANGERTAVTVGGVDANEIISSVFDPKSTLNGFRTGITFDQSPSYENPIYIDIDFNEGVEIPYLSRFGIKFNDYIASAIDVSVKTQGSDDYDRKGVYSVTDLNKLAHFSFLAYKVALNGTINTWQNVKAIRIILSKAYMAGDYNLDGKVGISYIWATDADHGGNAWLPRGGGRLYGDIDMGENYMGLGLIESLPQPTEEHRGKLIVQKDDKSGDKAYVCVYNGSAYEWKCLG